MLSESSQQSCRSLGTPDKIGALSGAGREIPAGFSRPMRQPSCSLPRRAVAAMQTPSAHLWTLEKSAGCVSHSGNPAETLTNIVHLDSAAVRHRRLLGLPAGARPREPRARGHHRAATRKRRPRPHAAQRGAGGPGRRAAAAAGASPTRRRIRASSTSPRRARIPYHSFLGVPLIDRGAAAGRARRADRRAARRSTHDDVRMLVTAGAQLAPLVSEARTLGQFVAPAHQRLRALAQNLWWSWDHETTQPVPRARPGAVARARPQPDRAARADPDRHSSRSAPRSSRCTAASTTPTAGCRSTCGSKRTWGARHAGVLWARPVAYFSAEFGLHESMPIYSGGLGILAGDHIKSASDLASRSSASGLYYDQGYFRQRLDRDGWQHEDYIDVDSRRAADRARDGRRRARHVSIETRTGDAVGARLEGGGRPQHAAAARFQRRGQPARRSRADGAALRRRRPRAHPAGAAARRRRRAGAARAGHHARRRAPERRAQRVRRAGAGAASAWTDEGHRRVRGHAPRVAARSSSPRTRRCPPATTGSRRELVEEHLGPLREALRRRATTT